MVFSGVRIPIYEAFRDQICSEAEKVAPPTYKKIAAGVTSGIIAALFATPLDGVRVKMQAQARGSAPAEYAGMIDCFNKTWKSQGMKGLYYGLGPNIIRNAVMNAAELVGYDSTRQFVRNHTGFDSENPFMYCVYGMMAGICGQLTGNPMDVIKTRMMNDGAKYGTPINCVKDLLRTEGPLGLYKGVKPGLARCCSFNTSFFFGVGFIRSQLAQRKGGE